MAVEAIKYFLYVKAEENYPDEEMEIWYSGLINGKSPRGAAGPTDLQSATSDAAQFLEFHIHGIIENEVAVMKVPFSLYEKNLEDFKKNPKSEIFAALRVRSYLSVKNMMRPEELK